MHDQMELPTLDAPAHHGFEGGSSGECRETESEVTELTARVHPRRPGDLQGPFSLQDLDAEAAFLFGLKTVGEPEERLSKVPDA
jgi:hypothetical protein